MVRIDSTDNSTFELQVHAEGLKLILMCLGCVKLEVTYM